MKMKAAAACCSVLLLVVLLAVVNAAPGQSRWRRQTTSNDTTTTGTTDTRLGPADNGTCVMIPYCGAAGCDNTNIECVWCPYGTVKSSDSRSCLACPTSCANCSISGQAADGKDIVQCDTCYSGYVLDSNKDCQYCGNLYTLVCEIKADGDMKAIKCVEKAHLLLETCYPCDSVCDTCDAVVSTTDPTKVDTTCTLCKMTYGFQANKPTCSSCPSFCNKCDNAAGKCDVKGCRDPYGRNAEGQCEACSSYCLTCSDSGAAKCDSGKCMKNVTDLLGQVSHYYPVIQEQTTTLCKKCGPYCLACNTADQCTTCVPGYYVENNVCKVCLANCKLCDRAGTCQTCMNGFVKRTTSGTDSCEACPTKCITCQDKPFSTTNSELTCDTCFPRNQLTDVNTCDECPINCQICNSAGQCLQCYNGYVGYGGLCYKCPEHCNACGVSSTGVPLCSTGQCNSTDTNRGRVVYNGNCIMCPESCTKCTVTSAGVTECLYSNCQSNSVWYPKDKTCKACPLNCGGYCTVEPESGDTWCVECKDEFTVDFDGKCLACPANCDDCWYDGSTTLCSESGCIWNYYQKLLNAAKSSNSALSTTCSPSGITGCKVPAPVPTLESTSAYCQLCEPGKVNTTDGCKSCTSQLANCGTCTPNGATTTCTVCNGNSVATVDVNSVITKCKACTSVATSCSTCTSTACQTCNTGYILHTENTCVACHSQGDSSCSVSSNHLNTDSCASGYFEKDDGCHTCPTGCSSCSLSGSTGKPQCSACMAGYYRDATAQTCTACTVTSKCATCTTSVSVCASCPAKHYTNGDVCTACMSNCDSCSDSDTCTTCTAGFSYNKDANSVFSCKRCTVSDCSSCVHNSTAAIESQCSQCNTGYAKTSTSTCIKCDTGCDSCKVNPTDDTKTICDFGQCSRGYIMIKSSGDTVKCQSCGSGCDACHTTTLSGSGLWCDACRINDDAENSYYLEAGNCTKMSSCHYGNSSSLCDDDACAPTYVSKWDSVTKKWTCVACPDQPSCLKCELDPANPANTKCIANKCVAGTTYYEGRCYACPANCASCSKNSTQVTCTTCKEGWAVNDGTDTCTDCGTGCKVCGNAPDVTQNCLTCDPGYLGPDTVFKNCSACSTQCSSCTIEDQPGQCDIGRCSAEYNRTTGTKECATCGSGCSVCTDLSADVTQACTKCKDGYTTDGGQNCTACAQGCKTCNANDPNTCLTCWPEYVKEGSDCVACAINCTTCSTHNSCDLGGCNVGYGRYQANAGDNATCELCPDNCDRCDVDKTKCDSDMCSARYARDASGVCNLIECPTYGYRVKTDYQTCQDPISYCNIGVLSGGTCPRGSCKHGSAWKTGDTCDSTNCPTHCMNCFIDINGQAACDNDGCKLGFGVTSAGRCVQCPFKCQHCDWDPSGNKMVCSVCQKKNWGLVPANTCLACPDNCASCQESGQMLQCTSCNSGFVLDTLNQLCIKCVSHCKECTLTLTTSSGLGTIQTTCTTCDTHYRLDTSAATCSACSSGCMKCDETTDVANSCDALQCYAGYVQGPTLACFQCPSSCSSRCRFNEMLLGITKVECHNTKEFYTAVGTSGISLCSDAGNRDCRRCMDAINCKPDGCKPTHSWDAGKCLRKPTDLGEGNEFCIAGFCPMCKEGFFMTRFGDNVTSQARLCKACDANCKICSDQTTDVTKIGTSKCDVCKDGFYKDTSSQCIACPSSLNCQTCALSGTVKCTTCTSNFYLDSTKNCVACFASPCGRCDSCSTCIDGYFKNTTGCVACNSTCATCSDSSKCITCKSSTPIKDSSTQYCFKCVDANAWNCELQGGKVLVIASGCNAGYAVSADRASCLRCPNDCMTCNYNMTCTDCYKGFLLNTDQCGRCPLNCQKCTTRSDGFDKRKSISCDICDPGYALFEGKCYVCSANCANCTASSGTTATTPTITCTKCSNNRYGLKSGACELCASLTTPNCYTCGEIGTSDNSSSTSGVYSCHSCSGNNRLSKDNQTCLSCDGLSCGSGWCGARPLCTACQQNYTVASDSKNCTSLCYKCDKGKNCLHIKDNRKTWDKATIDTVVCSGPCFFYTEYPIGGKDKDRKSWHGCADPNHKELNSGAKYLDLKTALDSCKGKAGNPETCVFSCVSTSTTKPCIPPDSAAGVVPLTSLIVMAIVSIWLMS